MNSWHQYVDGYCERLEPGYWAEPLNAITNLAFIISAIYVWQGIKSPRPIICQSLITILCCIGIGSYLLHTHSTRWAAFADVFFIAVFVVTYLYAANRYFLQLRPVMSLGLTLMIFIYIPLATFIVSSILPYLGASATYTSIAILILAYGFYLWRKMRSTAIGLLIGGSALVGSIVLRTLDGPFCNIIPIGTHFTWHLLNACILGWLILVLYKNIGADMSEHKAQ